MRKVEYNILDSAHLSQKIQAFLPSFTDKDSLSLLEDIFQKNREKGFMDFSVDSSMADSSGMTLWVYIGQYYDDADITYQIDSVARSYINLDTAYNMKVDKIEPFLDSVGKQSFDQVFDQGYLNTVVALDSFEWIGDGIKLFNSINSGTPYYLDSVINKGDLNLNYILMCKLLGFEKGVQFRPQMLKEVQQRIDAIDFIRLKGPALISFKDEKLNYELPLYYRNVNQANIVIGIQPNSLETSKLLLTGDAKLKLVNSLGRAERLEVSWQQLQYLSPRLIAQVEFPYIAYSNLGTSLEFNYFKKDTSWNNVKFGISGDYWFSQDQIFSIYYGSDVSRILTIDTNKITSSAFKMDFLDYSKKSYGIRYRGRKVDRYLGPRRGFTWLLDVAAKNRKVIRNQGIESLTTASGVSYNEIYDSLEQNNWQGALLASAEIYIPIRGGQNFVWYNKLQGNYLDGKYLFKNEMIQMGGYSSLRGYDDQSIYAKNYSMLLSEYQYHLGTNGYLYLFYNAAYIDQYYQSGNRYNLKMGFGLGLNILLENSQIGLNYAIGQNEEDKFDFRNGKVHIGYISTF